MLAGKRIILLLLCVIFTFSLEACSININISQADSSGVEPSEEHVVSLAWSNVPDSQSYTSTITALEEAGGTVAVLAMVRSLDLEYSADGKLINATDEHGILTEDAAETIKENTWHHSNVKEVLGEADCVVVPGGWDICPTLYRNVQGCHGIEEDSDFSPERDVSDYILISYYIDLEHFWGKLYSAS